MAEDEGCAACEKASACDAPAPGVVVASPSGVCLLPPSSSNTVKAVRAHIAVCCAVSLAGPDLAGRVEEADSAGVLGAAAQVGRAFKGVKGVKVTACSAPVRSARSIAWRSTRCRAAATGAGFLAVAAVLGAVAAHQQRTGAFFVTATAVAAVLWRELSRVVDRKAAHEAENPTADLLVFTPTTPRGELWRVRFSQLLMLAGAFADRPERPDSSAFDVEPLPWHQHTFFVCTHAARDKRCGRAGPLLAAALKNEAEEEYPRERVVVYETSHIGGHAHAGTLVHYPSAEWFGLLTFRDAPELLRRILEARDPRWDKKWRGNGWQPNVVDF